MWDRMHGVDRLPINIQRETCGRRIARSLPLAALCMILLSGCAPLAGPDYQRPEAPSKAAWSNQEAAPPVSAQATIQPDWWTGFEDPDLDHLIDRAIAGNIDIQILAARTGVAKAAISQARAGLLPTITGGEGTDSFKSTGRSRTTSPSESSVLVLAPSRIVAK